MFINDRKKLLEDEVYLRFRWRFLYISATIAAVVIFLDLWFYVPTLLNSNDYSFIRLVVGLLVLVLPLVIRAVQLDDVRHERLDHGLYYY